MGCEYYDECSFFNQPSMQQLKGLSGLFRVRYCDEDFSHCARLRIAETYGPLAVPEDMRPNDHPQADRVLGIASMASRSVAAEPAEASTG